MATKAKNETDSRLMVDSALSVELIRCRTRLEDDHTSFISKDLEGGGCDLFQNPIPAKLLREHYSCGQDSGQ